MVPQRVRATALITARTDRMGRVSKRCNESGKTGAPSDGLPHCRRISMGWRMDTLILPGQGQVLCGEGFFETTTRPDPVVVVGRWPVNLPPTVAAAFALSNAYKRSSSRGPAVAVDLINRLSNRLDGSHRSSGAFQSLLVVLASVPPTHPPPRSPPNCHSRSLLGCPIVSGRPRPKSVLRWLRNVVYCTCFLHSKL